MRKWRIRLKNGYTKLVEAEICCPRGRCIVFTWKDGAMVFCIPLHNVQWAEEITDG